MLLERRLISLGGECYEVRPMEAVVEGFEIWRETDELGFFILEADGSVDVCPTESFQVDEVMLRLVAERYLALAKVK